MIKSNTVIPAGFKVTKCPPGEANATPLRTLREQEEKALSLGFSSVKEMSQCERWDRENHEETFMEHFHDARVAGLSVNDALDEARAWMKK